MINATSFMKVSWQWQQPRALESVLKFRSAKCNSDFMVVWLEHLKYYIHHQKMWSYLRTGTQSIAVLPLWLRNLATLTLLAAASQRVHVQCFKKWSIVHMHMYSRYAATKIGILLNHFHCTECQFMPKMWIKPDRGSNPLNPAPPFLARGMNWSSRPLGHQAMI